MRALLIALLTLCLALGTTMAMPTGCHHHEQIEKAMEMPFVTLTVSVACPI